MDQKHESEEGLIRSLDFNDVKETGRLLQKLFNTIDAGDIPAVEKMLAEVSEPARRSLFEQYNAEGLNLLHFAIDRKKASMVMVLIERGANLDAKTRERTPLTPMELAVHSDDDAVIELLLDKLQNAKALAGHLAEAVRLKKKKYVNILLNRLNDKDWLAKRRRNEGWSEESVAAIAKVRSKEGNVIYAYTALDEAVRQGDAEMVRQVLAIPAFRQRIHEEGQNGLSAIHWACFQGNQEIFQELIRSADPKSLAADGGTILHHAVLGGDKNLEFVRYLLNIPDFSMWFLNALDSENKTPLYHACQLGAQNLIEELCQNQHAALSRVDNVSPLHIACERGDVKTTRKLLHYAPDVVEKWMQNRTYERGNWVDASDLDTPYEIAMKREFGANPPQNIIAVQEELISFMHRRMVEGGKDVTPLMQFKSRIFTYALNMIKSLPDKSDDIPGSHKNAAIKTAMLAMYNCLQSDYQDVVNETNPTKRQKIIARNNKILCLTKQLEIMAGRYAAGKDSKQDIAENFRNYCAKKIYSEKIKNLVAQVVGGIVGGVLFGAAGFVVGLGVSGGPAAPFTTVAGAVNGAVVGAAAGAAIGGAVAGAATVRQFLTTLKLQMCIWKVNIAARQQAKIPHKNLSVLIQSSSQSETEKGSLQDSEQLSDEQLLAQDSSSPR